MSDQEEYYEDDYDDDFDEEWIWFDDGEKDLADELAENTTHTPVYLDDLALDNLDYETDWEYYTDEYYDDEPSITRKQRIGSDDTTRTSGKKRKRSAEDDASGTSKKHKYSQTINANSFPGVVWRTTDPILPQKGELYEPGTAEKVSLLKNWREVFKYSPPVKEDRSALASTTHALSASKQKGNRNRPKLSNGITAAEIAREIGEHGAEELITEDELARIYEAIGGEPGTGPKREYTPPPSSLLPSTSEIAERPKKKSHNGTTQAPRSGSSLKDVVSVQDIPEDYGGIQDSHGQNSHPAEPPPAQDISSKENAKTTRLEASNHDLHAHPKPDAEPSSRRAKRKASTLDDTRDDTISKKGSKRARGPATKGEKQENKDMTKTTTESQAPATSRPKRNLRERKK